MPESVPSAPDQLTAHTVMLLQTEVSCVALATAGFTGGVVSMQNGPRCTAPAAPLLTLSIARMWK